MGHNFKEVAHLRTNKSKYDENFDRIFGKKDVPEKIQGIEPDMISIDEDCFETSSEDLEKIMLSKNTHPGAMILATTPVMCSTYRLKMKMIETAEHCLRRDIPFELHLDEEDRFTHFQVSKSRSYLDNPKYLNALLDEALAKDM